VICNFTSSTLSSAVRIASICSSSPISAILEFFSKKTPYPKNYFK